MNQRSGHGSFDASVTFFQLRQCLYGRGFSQHEGDRPTFGSVGGLALCAGLGLHGSDARGEVVTERLGRDLGAPQFRMLGDEVLHVAAISLTERASRAEGDGVAGQQVFFGEVGKVEVHGGSRSGPIPAMSNPNPVTSDESSTLKKKIMNNLNEPAAYELTDQGRALNASYQRGYRDGHKAAMETLASLVKSLANADSPRYLPPDVAAVMFPDKEVK